MTEMVYPVSILESQSTLEFFKQVIDQLEEGVFFVDFEQRITYWNKACETITGFTSNEMLGKHCCNRFQHLDENDEPVCTLKCPIQETLYTKRVYECELKIPHKQGHPIPVYVRTMPLFDSSGHVIGATEFLVDITMKRELLRKVEYLERKSSIDKLTDLPNRSLVEHTIKSRFNEFERYGWTFGLILIDIDHFKEVNDQYGHTVGDIVLKKLSGIFQKKQRTCDMIGRWGGEEFIGIMSNVEKLNLFGICERIRLMVENTSIDIEKKQIRVTVSIGGSLIAEGDTIDSLLKRADRVMYESKNKGRNCVTIG